MIDGKQIVVLDDDIFLSQMISEILTFEGYTATLFANGEELLAQLENCRPDLILLDIKMPGMSGYDVLKAIRQKSQVPVIMLTGVTETDSVSACMEMGADDYIKKPFYPHELIARVRAKLRRSALQSA